MPQYFYDSTYTGTSTGTEAQPYKTLDAVSLTSAGTQMFLKKGSTFIKGMTPSADNISVQAYGYGYGTALPKIDCSSQVTGAAQRGIDGSSGMLGFSVQDLEIYGGTLNGCMGIYLSPTTFNDAGYAAYRGTRITRVKIHDFRSPVNTTSGGSGIYHGGSGLSVTDSEVWNCTNENIWAAGDDSTFHNLYLANPDAEAHTTAEGDCIQMAFRYARNRITNVTANHANRNSKQCFVLSGATVQQADPYIGNNLIIGCDPLAPVALDTNVAMKMLYMDYTIRAQVIGNVFLGGAYALATEINPNSSDTKYIDNYAEGYFRDTFMLNRGINTLVEFNTIKNIPMYSGGTRTVTKGIKCFDAAATGFVVRKNHLQGFSTAVIQPIAANDMSENINNYYDNLANYAKNDDTPVTIGALSTSNVNHLGRGFGSRRFPTREGEHVRGKQDFAGLVGYQSKFVAEA